ncbi:zinc finger protein 180-like [Topomyia yanbarensis]|uniref:zinc finger protein 180-like n=1 Tax=Topomyia yanbarensis TaxID=2498891 RepID=UPI00273BF300|nr:zinc finger protein 180-like [Topomyia yanbarensis]
MSEFLFKSLVENNFRVCRFCLQSNEKELCDIYENIFGKTNLVSINTTVRNVLALLDIQVTQNDTYPNFICRRCRDLLFSIQQFRETVQKSAQHLAQAKLLKEFPNVKFVDSLDSTQEQDMVKTELELEEESVSAEQVEDVEITVEEILVENEKDSDQETEISRSFQEEQNKAAIQLTIEALTDENEKDTVQGMENNQSVQDEQSMASDEIVKNEYIQTEWIVYEQIDIPPEQEEYTETLYLEDESQHEEGSPIDYKSAAMFLDIQKDDEQHAPKANSKRHCSAPKICPICGTTSTAMVVHMRTHSKLRPFACHSCSKSFYTSNKLRCHIQSAHISERSFQCEICEKAFKLKKTLNAHMMSHLSEKSYACSLCQKSFLFRWALAKHQRTHTGEKPFVCTLDGCGKSFVSSSNLRQHQKTSAHLRQPRKDACDECGKLFQSKYALRAHRKVHELKEMRRKQMELAVV